MKINTLEEYLMHLGAHAAGLVTLMKLQHQVDRSGMLQDDEIECGETIIHQASRLMTCLNDQCKLTSQRVEGGWDKMREGIVNKLRREDESI